MSWELTEKIINKSREFNIPLNYSNIMSAILEDMHIKDDKIKSINNSRDFFEYAVENFPINSDAYYKAMEISRLKYILENKNEFIAAVSHKDAKDGDYTNIQYLERALIEFDPTIIQICVCGIISFDVDSKTVYIVVSDESSDMAGTTGFVSGHIKYSYSTQFIGKIYAENIRREILEELGVDIKDFIINIGTPSIYFENFKSASLKSIDRYHMGIGIPIKVKPVITKNINEEPGKKLVLYYPGDNDPDIDVRNPLNKRIEIFNKSNFFIAKNPDTWLTDFLKRI